MGNAGGNGVESIHRQKGGVMFETAADNSSILSIDLGMLIGIARHGAAARSLAGP